MKQSYETIYMKQSDSVQVMVFMPNSTTIPTTKQLYMSDISKIDYGSYQLFKG